MKKQIILATFLYFLSFIALISSLYGFFNYEVKMIIFSLLFVVVMLGSGYMFNTYLLKHKFEVDEEVLDATHEILHEITLPISTIQANSSLLKKSLQGDEKALKRLERIDSASVRLERLYDELLYSIEKKIFTIEKEVVELHKLLEERVEIFKLQKRNPFILQLEEKKILIDKIGFEKIIDNVLTNAMKYSPRDQAISIVLKSNYLTITDKGKGMDDEELKKVCKRYYQSDKNREGKGIGLALVKAFCNSQKIALKIESSKESGTKIIFDLEKVIFIETK